MGFDNKSLKLLLQDVKINHRLKAYLERNVFSRFRKNLPIATFSKSSW